jgi:hypothetical protein
VKVVSVFLTIWYAICPLKMLLHHRTNGPRAEEALHEVQACPAFYVRSALDPYGVAPPFGGRLILLFRQRALLALAAALAGLRLRSSRSTVLRMLIKVMGPCHGRRVHWHAHLWTHGLQGASGC